MAAAFLFPSPLGDPYIQIDTGRTILIAAVFPSPLGDPYIQMVRMDRTVQRRFKFPSPLGDPYIQMKILDAQGFGWMAVSVPSRRSLYSNYERYCN